MAELIPDITNQVFREGSVVEVSLDHSQFHKSWYSATVLGLYTRKIQVKFQNLCDESNKPLIRFVDLERVRPIPPPDLHGGRLIEGLKIDVREDCGWWEGYIVTAYDSDDMFLVFLDSNQTVRRYLGSQLRMHKVWMNNRWVLPALHPVFSHRINIRKSTTDEAPKDDKEEKPTWPAAAA